MKAPLCAVEKPIRSCGMSFQPNFIGKDADATKVLSQ